MKLSSLAFLALAACGDPCAKRIPKEQATPMPKELGSIQGVVLFKGEPPKNPAVAMSECRSMHEGMVFDEQVLVAQGRLKNAVVYVKTGLEAYTFATPEEPVVIENSGCLYVPRVSAAMIYQRIRFSNGDPLLHNIHGEGEPSFNFSLSGKGAQKDHCIDGAGGPIALKCDVHPWMKGVVWILPHPKFAVTREDGSFEIAGLPPGDYTIEAWHETLGTRTLSVACKPGPAIPLTFTFEPR